MPVFYDTHAHLDNGSYRADLPQVIERAHGAGIEKIICIGTDFADSERVIRIAEQYPNVYAAVGWHPSQAMDAPREFKPTLRKLAQHPKVKAIGEIGMDYYWLPSKKDGQRPLTPTLSPSDGERENIRRKLEQDEEMKRREAEIFVEQLEVAAELGLNCVIHEREALEDTFKLLEPFVGRLRGVFHCFSRDAAVSARLLEMNFLVSYTGIVTFKNSPNVRKSLEAVPLGKFMLETDCPYMTPEPHRGKVRRNEPMYVKEIAQVAAEIKGCTLEELSEATCGAAKEFFRLG